MPDASFGRVIDVALHVRDALDKLGLVALPKTSGATGMHIVVPLPSGVPALAARLLAEVVATRVAARHPTLATITRGVRSRPTDAVYVDYLQNITGKSIASVYSARASVGAGVSTPLAWEEVRPGLDPREFTIVTVPRRVSKDGDRWAAAMSNGNGPEALEGLSRLARDWSARASRG